MPDPITITQDATPPVEEEVVANLEAEAAELQKEGSLPKDCLLYTSPSPRDS